MSLVMLVKVAHVLIAMLLVSGLLGRWVVLAAAARARTIDTTTALLDAANRFEIGMVRPASILVLLSGLWLAWLQGQPLLGVFQGSSANWLLVSLLLYLSSVPLVAFVFAPRGRQFAVALAGAQQQGVVTADLRRAFADRTVFTAHVFELASVVAIVALMVGKFV